MQLQLRDFASLVSNAAAAVQAASRALVDLSVGSTLRAILEANASIGLWMQWLILRVQRMTRAATSDGEDLDSWVGDYDLARLPAVSAIGQARFARFTATEAALVPAGTACDLRHFSGGQSPVPDAVELRQAGEGDMGDVEVQPHANGIGGDEIVDLARLIEFHMGIARHRR